MKLLSWKIYSGAETAMSPSKKALVQQMNSINSETSTMTYIRGSNFANRRLKDVLPRLIKGIHVFSQKLCDILLMGPMQSFS